MASTFAGIELGKRSLMASSEAIQTTGHNISNADTEGYSRQRVQFRAVDPLDRPDLTRAERAGQIGQGVTVESVSRVRDELLDQRIVEQTSTESYWATRDKYYTRLDQIYNEPLDVSVRGAMDQFWRGWQELSSYPDSNAARQVVVTRGESLASTIRGRHDGLEAIRTQINGDIDVTTRQVNDYARQIADVNREIVKVRAHGDRPNDLLDRRDLLVEKLGTLVNVTTVEQDADEFMVHIDGQIIVQGGAYLQLGVEAMTENNGYSRIVWADTGDDAIFDVVSHSGVHAGTLGALIELRDGDLRREIQSLDTMAVNFADMVNDIHRNAVGANDTTGLDFFVSANFAATADGAYDANGDGAMDSTYLFRLTGTNELRGQDQIGFGGVITIAGKTANIDVPYLPTDTVTQVIERINNSDGEVKAYLDRDNRLALKATTASEMQNPDFVIRHVEDSGYFLTNYAGLLAAAGPEGAFDYAVPDAVNSLVQAVAPVAPAPGVPAPAVAVGATWRLTPALAPAAYMNVNRAVQADPLSVAAAYRDPSGRVNSGDGRAASDIASIRNTAIMVGRSRTLDDYFADTVTNVGLLAEQAVNMSKTQAAIMKDLRDERASISGVNMDEELADMIRFQHGYNAAAKFVSVIDEMLDTIINRVKV